MELDNEWIDRIEKCHTNEELNSLLDDAIDRAEERLSKYSKYLPSEQKKNA